MRRALRWVSYPIATALMVVDLACVLVMMLTAAAIYVMMALGGENSAKLRRLFNRIVGSHGHFKLSDRFYNYVRSTN